jgi:hypothetical protein
MCFIFLNACLIYRIKYEIVIPRSNVGPTIGLMVGECYILVSERYSMKGCYSLVSEPRFQC